VVVDTGSRDRTAEIAAAAGARVLHEPWQDDFAAPRNRAACEATGDFLLILDADERLAPGAGARLRAEVEAARFDLGFLRLHNAAALGAAPEAVLAGAARSGRPVWVPRLVRRTPDLEWRGVIHETVAEWWIRRGSAGARLDADIVHLGAVPSIQEAREKRARNLRLLQRRVALDPQDVVAFGYLALELHELGRFRDSAAAAERGWSSVLRCPPERQLRRLAVARALCALGDNDPVRALETLQVVRDREGPHPDYAFLAACAEELLGGALEPADPARRVRLEAAVRGQLAALELLREDAEQVLVADTGTVFLRLGTALLLLGRASEAIAAFEQAGAAGVREEARWGVAEARIVAGDAAAALGIVEGGLTERPDGWLVAALAAQALGAGGDARTLVRAARARQQRGFSSPHRRKRLNDLEEALRAAP